MSGQTYNLPDKVHERIMLDLYELEEMMIKAAPNLSNEVYLPLKAQFDKVMNGIKETATWHTVGGEEK